MMKIWSVVIFVVLLFGLTELSFAEKYQVILTPPVTNADGSVCTDIAGYELSYGITQATLGDPVDIGNVTTKEIDVPSCGLFVKARAYDTSGNRSEWTPVTGKLKVLLNLEVN